jgi:hypothetical protein
LQFVNGTDECVEVVGEPPRDAGGDDQVMPGGAESVRGTVQSALPQCVEPALRRERAVADAARLCGKAGHGTDHRPWRKTGRPQRYQSMNCVSGSGVPVMVVTTCAPSGLAEGARRGRPMATFTRSDDLRRAQFVGVDLRDARFVGADLSGVVMRGVEVQRVELDSPWLLERENVLLVNGVDVLPFVEAELNRRFPGRAERRAADPGGLRAAWAMVESTWAATLARVAGMPAGTVDVSVGGEWSFAQTLRHLVFATDMWLGRAILESGQPFHPIGVLDAGTEGDGREIATSTAATPRCSRSGRVGSRWCATSSPRSPPTYSSRRAGIRTRPSIRRPSCPACT